jgi:hypothetical protein
MPTDGRLKMWEALRHLISKHLEFPDAEWSLPMERISRLLEVYEFLTPEDFIARAEWLFRHTPDLPEAGVLGWEERQRVLEARQIKSATDVYKQAGLKGILLLAKSVQNQWVLGAAVASVIEAPEEYQSLLKSTILSEDARLLSVGRGFLWSLALRRPDDLTDLLRADWTQSWPSGSRAELYLPLPFLAETWDELHTEPEEVEYAYWRMASPFGRGPELDRDLVDRAVREWLSHSQPVPAIHLLSLYRAKSTASLALDALREIIQHPPDSANAWNDLGYRIGDLLDIVRASEGVTDSQVARLEWTFLPILRQLRHDFRPETLNRLLASDPEFFVEVLRTLYRREGAEPAEPTPDQQARATQAFELLYQWNILPGERDGDVDPETLRSWVSSARARAQAEGLQRAADAHIGQILARSPVGSDGVWPHESVRVAIEAFANDEMIEGFVTGVYNSRGMTSRELFEGGAQERTQAKQYLNAAQYLAKRWPQTATALTRVAEGYESEARREDIRAQLNREEWA